LGYIYQQTKKTNMQLKVLSLAALAILIGATACNNGAKEEVKTDATEINVSSGDGNVTISSDSTSVKSADGGEVKIDGNGISVKDANGKEVKVGSEGVTVKDEDGDNDGDEVKTETKTNGNTKVEVKDGKVDVKAGKNTDVKVNKNGKIDVNAGGVKVKIN
jgi:hypothetical protein